MNRVIRLFPRLAVCGALFLWVTFSGAHIRKCGGQGFCCADSGRSMASNCITRRVVTHSADPVARLCGDFADVDADPATAR